MGDAPVVVDTEAVDNGLAVMLSDLLAHNLHDRPERLTDLSRLDMVVAVHAPDIETELTMSFKKGTVTFFNGADDNPAVTITAGADELLNLSLIKMAGLVPVPFTPPWRRMMADLLAGRLRIGGLFAHPLSILRLMRLMSVQ